MAECRKFERRVWQRAVMGWLPKGAAIHLGGSDFLSSVGGGGGGGKGRTCSWMA